ncbi:PTS sugar transporter subunit IIA [Tahibacter amnicola]|uniref:PTS sugar transporter subunit IIA n=1 Tax=Tahibacter amnicola TaxID=2976241 RepID=A0ABY6BCD4_9GAMM|nr:PTS sugar transporter subunit IIA [Tahibacter amnicola]UXI67500.1 PTS sugar transporter subunit IIA [Tahibacter amnicola]
MTELLTPESVVADLRVSSRHALLESLARLLAPEGDDLAVLEALAERESLGSTALGNGIALPHGRCAGIGRPSAAFARLRKPIAFGAADGKPVDLVAAIVTPNHFTTAHLSLLADIAARASDPTCVERLRKAPDASALYDELAKWGEPA